MARRRGIRGKSTQGDRPQWQPLLNAVGERVTGDFMWMYEVELSDGTSLQVYTHVDTRRSVHLASNGDAYFFEPPDRYVGIAAADVFAEVFAELPLLAGVTEEQVGASWEAVERLVDTG